MDENTKQSGHPATCMCPMCRGGMSWTCGKYCVWHIVLKILIILVVFWLGMQFGELHVYRSSMMMGEGGGYGYRTVMMGGGYGPQSDSGPTGQMPQSVTVTSSATPVSQ